MSELRTVAEMLAFAAINNLLVVYPQSNELFVDIDDHESLLRFNSAIELLCNEYPYTEVTQEPSTTPDHWHIRVRVKSTEENNLMLSDAERCALQAALGSDFKRELLTACRILRGERSPSLFFEKDTNCGGLSTATSLKEAPIE